MHHSQFQITSCAEASLNGAGSDKFSIIREVLSVWIPLKRGVTVRIKPFQLDKGERQKGIVRSRLDERPYEVETPHDVVLRNRVHARKTNEPSPRSSDEGLAEVSLNSSLLFNEVQTTVPEEVNPPSSSQGNASLRGPEFNSVPLTAAVSTQASAKTI